MPLARAGHLVAVPHRLEAEVKTKKTLIWIVILASAWGLAELFGKELLIGLGLKGTSIWLAAWAVLLLAIARGIWNRVGSSSIIGLMAAAFKFAGPSTSYCHLLGIASLGIFFDLFASSLLFEGRAQGWRRALVGALTVYAARTFFVLYSVYISQSWRWVDGGLEMGLQHVIGKGSLAALFGFVLAPLGFRLGEKILAMATTVGAGHDEARSEA